MVFLWQIGDKGATAVADALRNNFSLEILSLNRNRIGYFFFITLEPRVE